MPDEPILDRHGLHLVLWLDSSPASHTLRVNQRDLATLFGLSTASISRAVAELVAEGRLRPLEREVRRPVKYRVADPSAWEDR